MPTLLEKYVAVAYSAVVALTVHRSLLPWLPVPSVTHVPLLVTWQYAEPEDTVHMVPAATGGDGLGGGGMAAGSVEPQIVKPPAAAEESA